MKMNKHTYSGVWYNIEEYDWESPALFGNWITGGEGWITSLDPTEVTNSLPYYFMYIPPPPDKHEDKT